MQDKLSAKKQVNVHSKSVGVKARVCLLTVPLLMCFSHAAFAGAFDPAQDWSSLQAKSESKPCKNYPEKPIVYNRSYQYYIYQYPYFYFGAGIGAYKMKNPATTIGNLANSSTPIASVDDNGFTPIFNLDLGYAFYNPYDTVFGHFNDIAIKISYLRTDSKKRGDFAGNTQGRLWRINGGGSLTVNPADIYDYSLQVKHQFLDTGIYYRSISSVADVDKLNLYPRVGMVFSYLGSEHNALVRYDKGITNFTYDKEDYKVKTYYFGLAAGGKLACHVASQFLLYGDAELQLLYATSSLNATQQTDTALPQPIINVKATHSKIATYRATAALGAKYYLAQRADSVSFDVKAGLDRFGYNPKVVTPSSANNSEKIHLEDTSQNNFFTTFDVVIPLG